MDIQDDDEEEEIIIDGFNLKEVARQRDMIKSVLAYLRKQIEEQDKKTVEVNEESTKLYPTITAFRIFFYILGPV